MTQRILQKTANAYGLTNRRLAPCATRVTAESGENPINELLTSRLRAGYWDAKAGCLTRVAAYEKTGSGCLWLATLNCRLDPSRARHRDRLISLHQDQLKAHHQVRWTSRLQDRSTGHRLDRWRDHRPARWTSHRRDLWRARRQGQWTNHLLVLWKGRPRDP